jgi:YD repeat-containing protein
MWWQGWTTPEQARRRSSGDNQKKGTTTMNIIPFKRVEEPTRVESLRDRVERIELEAAYARSALELDEVRARRRELQAEIAWRSIRGMLILAFLLWLAHAFAAPAKAADQSRSFYDGQGRFAGSSNRYGRTTNFYDNRGRLSGTAIVHGNGTSFYDGRGRFAGSETRR